MTILIVQYVMIHYALNTEHGNTVNTLYTVCTIYTW